MNTYILTATIAMAIAGGFLTSHYVEHLEEERPSAQAEVEQLVDRVRTSWRQEEANAQ